MREFAALCALHPYPGVRPIPYISLREFLDRCCDVGFLERRWENGARYYPTEALDEWASWFD